MLFGSNPMRFPPFSIIEDGFSLVSHYWRVLTMGFSLFLHYWRVLSMVSPYNPYYFTIVYVGVSENVVYPIVPNGFHDHYPIIKNGYKSLGRLTQHFQTNPCLFPIKSHEKPPFSYGFPMVLCLFMLKPHLLAKNLPGRRWTCSRCSNRTVPSSCWW